MAKALVNQFKLLTKNHKHTSAIEQEFARDIETLSKVPGFTGIGFESTFHFPSHHDNRYHTSNY
jgi:hypothetical protein